ncbi:MULTISPECIES: aminotransferase class I/II-fold pyridoxal phosphate-dependent enzyme [unclassified Streptomyces]|uniref:aminotransferase class I/II-fold pyridoxal phosphate-dependent enzyme n=1 Tax=unclassified Streptomyces TaxID=2593676 RepID=UPI00036DF16E|nr:MULTISPECIES: aminotransferase class I/II-fold pyridoxal phosphate-dependent enzyme [unclassified Streptomyces]MYT33693.1 aminotransferase class I/II-fold pyridoxal phosphate-dependent enzyme [Streptomyces sp. SID8354]
MTKPTKAVVLAAGLGRRLGLDNAKPLLPVAGKPILIRTLENLAAAGVRETVLVVGHLADDVRTVVGESFAGMDVSYVESDAYRTTNNAYSLWLAHKHLDQDVYLIEGDVVFDGALLGALTAADGEVVTALAPYRPPMNGTVVTLDAAGTVSAMLLPAQQGPGLDLTKTFKTVNVHLLREEYLREEFVPALEKLIAGGGHGAYYEQVIADTVTAGRFPVHGVDCGRLRWYEVDDLTDHGAAEYLFSSPDDRLTMLENLHGGYWRYDLVDHRLLYNLYFPPTQLVDELARDFRDALVHYPMGHRALQQLLGAAIRQPPERLVVANGASELIKILGGLLGRVGLVVPGFNEYEAVFDEADIHRIHLPAPAFTMDPERVAEEARQAGVAAVIITSPNNPTSMAVPRADLVTLARSLAGAGIRLVVDESFVDFCAPGHSLEPDLAGLPGLTVVKSMSKVYGIGGLRLGYLLSADVDFVADVRAALPIWNVNGFAECFLRLLPRYQDAFTASCTQVRRDRDELAALLAGLPGVTVYPPDANYVMVRLPEGVSALAVVRRTFAEHGILLKDCGGKSMPDGDRYLRVSCRTPRENALLTDSLAAVLAGRPAPLTTGVS